METFDLKTKAKKEKNQYGGNKNIEEIFAAADRYYGFVEYFESLIKN